MVGYGREISRVDAVSMRNDLACGIALVQQSTSDEIGNGYDKACLPHDALATTQILAPTPASPRFQVAYGRILPMISDDERDTERVRQCQPRRSRQSEMRVDQGRPERTQPSTE